MKRAMIFLAILALVILTVSAAPPVMGERPSPRQGGHLEQGGKAFGSGYGHAGKEFGRGTAGFATNLVKADFGDAGRSMGRGGAEFGKGVGKGTARGFTSFGRAFVNLGRKIDRAVSDKR